MADTWKAPRRAPSTLREPIFGLLSPAVGRGPGNGPDQLERSNTTAVDIASHQATKEKILIQFLKFAVSGIEQSGNSVFVSISVLSPFMSICYVLVKQFKSAGESVVAAVEEAALALERRVATSVIGVLHRRFAIVRGGCPTTARHETTANRNPAPDAQT